MNDTLELIRADALKQIKENMESLPAESNERDLLGMFVDSRHLMQSVDIRKSLFVEELAWLNHIEAMGRWVYSRGVTEKCSSDDVRELLRLRLQSIELTLQTTLACPENPGSSSSTTFFNDVTNLCHEQLSRSFLLNAQATSADLHSLFPLMSMRSGEARVFFPLASLESLLTDRVELFVDQPQSVEFKATAAGKPVFLAPTSKAMLVDSLYNKWINNSSSFDVAAPRCELSYDGRVCSLDKIRLGEIARLLLYLKDKYDTYQPAGRLFMTNETILQYCCEPVTVRERLRELVYFDAQGDLNPFVYLSGNHGVCLRYARSVLNRTSAKEGPVYWPLSKNLDVTQKKKTDPSERKYPLIIKVVASSNIVTRNYNVHQTDGQTIKRFWIKDDDKDLSPEVISAIAEYERNELIKLQLNQ